MEAEQEEEIESLKAIFCQDGELEIKKDSSGTHITVLNNGLKSALHLNITDELWRNISLQFSLPQYYPSTDFPHVTLTCPLFPQASIKTLTDKIHDKATQLQGHPMLMDLICYAQELLSKELLENMCLGGAPSVSQSLVERGPAQHELSPSSFNEKDSMPLLSCNSTGNCANHKLAEKIIALLLLDHMRSKQSYSKLIKKWVLELGLTGRLLFCNKLILILLLGDAKNVKDYIIRNKTINVDVDAKGRSCKEKMLTVLCELPVQPGVSITEFSVMELESVDELQKLFLSFSLADIYQEYIENLLAPCFKKKK